MNVKRRHVGRRLVLFVASVLPLFADDVAVVQHHELPLVDHNDWQQVNDDNEYSSLPQHVMNHHARRELHDDAAHPEMNTYRKYHRKYIRGNQQWVEQVWLPTQQFNGTTVIPFYPFESENHVIDTTTIADDSPATLQWNASNHEEAEIKNDDNGDDVTNQHHTSLESHKDRIQENETIVNSDNNAAVTDTSDRDSRTVSTTDTTTTTTTPKRIQHVEVDYASKSAGAVILDSSANFQGVSNLLQQDRDKYAIVPCVSSSSTTINNNNNNNNDDASATTEPKYVVIGLSEDILVKQFAIANYERYSSHMKEIRLYGSVSTNAIRQQSHWIHLGDFTALKPNTNNSEKQTFDLSEPTWARYLKVEFISHYGDEYYCTISQISVHGSTVLQGFHEQWNEENDDDNNNNNNIENIPDNTETTSSQTSTDTSNRVVEHIASTGEQVVTKTQETALLRETESSRVKLDASNGHSIGMNAKSSIERVSVDTSTTTVPTNFRYNFSRVTGCRNSLSFEENLMYYTSHHKNVSAINGLSTSMSARPSRSSFTNLCAATAKTTMTPKRSIRKVQVRHAPRSEKPSGNVLHRSIVTPNIQNRQLSKLSLGLERVTEFLRNTIEGFNASKMTMMLLHATEQGTLNEENEETRIYDDGIQVDNESDTSITENVKVEDHKEGDDLLELNGLMIAKVLKRLPSAKCLETLNFAEYKSNQKTASSKPRSGSSGGGPQTNGGGGSGNAVSNMEPIFKKLTDEIKALQSNVGLHDQFTKESVSCYQRVLFEMLLEMESDRRLFDERITKLEDEIQFATFIVATRRLAIRMFISALKYCLTSLHVLVPMKQFGVADSAVEPVLSFAILLLFCAIVMALYAIIVVRRRRYRNIMVANKQNELNIVKDNTISFQFTNHNTSEDDDDSSAEILPLSPMEQPLEHDKGKGIKEQ